MRNGRLVEKEEAVIFILIRLHYYYVFQVLLLQVIVFELAVVFHNTTSTVAIVAS